MSIGTVSDCRDSPMVIASTAVSLADQMVAQLAAAGIHVYFGVPGGAAEPLFNAMARQQRLGNIRVVPMRSEAGAAFAGDGYFRATGHMAACVTTTGPGITNLVTGVMSAAADRIPMLLLTPQVPLARQGRGAFQDCCPDAFDLVSMLRLCTRYSTAVTHPRQLSSRLSKALQIALTPPGGPVHLSISSDLLAGLPDPEASPNAKSHLPLSTPLDRHAVAILVDEILEAQCPVFLVGEDAGPEARRLCEIARALDGAIVTSPGGKRWISHLDSTYRGVIGFAGHATAVDALRRADLIVAFGATFDELSNQSPRACADVPTVLVDRHASFAYRQPDSRLVIASTGQVIEEIVNKLPVTPGDVVRMRTLAPPTLVRSVYASAVHPRDLMQWLNRRLPDDVVVHIDTGSSLAWSTRELKRPVPDTYRVATGACSMCWAISAAIGAAVAHRKRVLCVTGDGAMLMSSLELTVAVEQNLPITYVVLNDSSLGMVKHGQQLSGAEVIASHISPVRFDQLARACGLQAIRVECREDLDAIPSSWLDDLGDGPRLIDVRIDANITPPIGQRIAELTRGVHSP